MSPDWGTVPEWIVVVILLVLAVAVVLPRQAATRALRDASRGLADSSGRLGALVEALQRIARELQAAADREPRGAPWTPDAQAPAADTAPPARHRPPRGPRPNSAAGGTGTGDPLAELTASQRRLVLLATAYRVLDADTADGHAPDPDVVEELRRAFAADAVPADLPSALAATAHATADRIRDPQLRALAVENLTARSHQLDEAVAGGHVDRAVLLALGMIFVTVVSGGAGALAASLVGECLGREALKGMVAGGIGALAGAAVSEVDQAYRRGVQERDGPERAPDLDPAGIEPDVDDVERGEPADVLHRLPLGHPTPGEPSAAPARPGRWITPSVTDETHRRRPPPAPPHRGGRSR